MVWCCCRVGEVHVRVCLSTFQFQRLSLFVPTTGTQYSESTIPATTMLSWSSSAEDSKVLHLPLVNVFRPTDFTVLPLQTRLPNNSGT